MAQGTSLLAGSGLGQATTSPSPSPFEVALKEFKLDLKKSGINQGKKAVPLNLVTLDQLKQEINDLQTRQHSRRTLRNMQRLRGFLEATEQFGKVVEVFCQVHEVVAFVWGPLKFLLQIISAHVEAIHELIGVYKDLGDTISFLQQSWELHPRDDKLEAVLVSIYKDILKFHLQALTYFTKSSLKAMFSATWKNHKAKFSDLVEGMKEHRYIIIGNTSMAEYRENRRHREQMAIEKRLEKNDQVFQQLRSWLESADVENDHHRLRKAQTEGTGRWLFDHPLFKRWFEPKSPYVPLLLWLNGKPGAGKSVLSSMIVEEAKKNGRQQNPQPAVLYFYCKNEVDEKNNFSAIGRSLLLQLLEPDSPILDHLHSAFRNNKTKDTILRTRHMIEDLLEAALLSCPSAYIILDGIDECQLEEREPIVAWFKTFVTQKLPKGCEAQVRVLFVSQDDMRARRDFSGITSLAIKVEDNKGDMELFAQGKAKEIKRKFSTSDEIRSVIATKVPQSSDGIFLLARLICDNLLCQATPADLEAELQDHVFPKEINDAYERIMKRILAHASSKPSKDRLKEYCMMLFGWLVCAKRPLKWYEIQCAKAFDQETQNIDDKRKFIVEAKELCGSLIEYMDDGTITFVHLTARWFLLERNHINFVSEEVKMTTLCIEYLKLPALAIQPIEYIDQYVSQGCYGFMDYAISNWVRHFEAAATRIGEDQASAEKMVELEESLEVFLDIHWAEPRKPAEVADRHRDKLRIYEQVDMYRRLVWAFGWARKLVKSHASISAAETVLDLLTILVQVRQRIEEAWQKSEHDVVVRDSLQTNYGNDIYKCPRPSCHHFNHGFEKKSSRDEHVSKHERFYRCNVEGCPSSVLGFTKQRDLQKHMDNTHDSYTVGDEGKHSFPKPGETRKAAEPAPKPQQTATESSDRQSDQQSPSHNDAQNVSVIGQTMENEPDDTTVTPTDDSITRRSPSPATPEPMPPPERPALTKKVKGPTVYECSTCNKKYGKKSNYDSHMRIHSQEKPFSCAYCSKGFARVNDRKRHEAGHAATRFVCRACGKDFKRRDTLQNHFRSQMGRKCFESLHGINSQGSA